MIALLYYLLAVLVYIAALPYLIFLSFKKKYKDAIPARFFLYKNPFFKSSNIWFHACSLGEVKSLESVVEALKQDVNISVITDTGFKEASRLTKSVRYLPFEIFQPFWQKKSPVLVVLEAELWYMLFLVAKRRGDKTILLNARISDNSYKSYKRFAFFYKKIFENIDEVFAQSIKDKERLLELGAKEVKVLGNIKNAMNFKITKRYKKPEDRRVIIFASTHEGEEELILSHLKKEKNDTLIVVPRHPERFKKVDDLLLAYASTNSLKYKKIDEGLEADIILCDKMGELINLYAISDIVLLCGSFVDGIGGHNPLEPANFNNIIISGRYTFNQNALFDKVENIYVCDLKEINTLLKESLQKAYIKEKFDLSPLIDSIKLTQS